MLPRLFRSPYVPLTWLNPHLPNFFLNQNLWSALLRTNNAVAPVYNWVNTNPGVNISSSSQNFTQATELFSDLGLAFDDFVQNMNFYITADKQTNNNTNVPTGELLETVNLYWTILDVSLPSVSVLKCCSNHALDRLLRHHPTMVPYSRRGSTFFWTPIWAIRPCSTTPISKIYVVTSSQIKDHPPYGFILQLYAFTSQPVHFSTWRTVIQSGINNSCPSAHVLNQRVASRLVMRFRYTIGHRVMCSLFR